MPPVPAVKGDRITGEQSPHQGCQANRAGTKQKVGMVRHQHPRIAGRLRFGQQEGKSPDESIAIFIVFEYISTLYPTDHDMVHNTGSLLAIARLRQGGRASRRANLGIYCLLPRWHWNCRLKDLRRSPFTYNNPSFYRASINSIKTPYAELG